MSKKNEPTQIVKPIEVGTNTSGDHSSETVEVVLLKDGGVAPVRVSLVSLAMSDTVPSQLEIDEELLYAIEEIESSTHEPTPELGPDLVVEDDEEEKARIQREIDEELERLAGPLSQTNKTTAVPQAISAEEMKPQFPQTAPEANNGGGTSDVLGLGAMAKTLASMIGFKQQDVQVVRQQAAARFEVQKKQLDEMIFSAQTHSQKLQESNTGQIAQGFLDQGVEPPVSAMKSAYALDEDAQSSWKDLQNEMGRVESQVGLLQRTAETAEFSPLEIKEDLKTSVEKLSKDASSNLKGLTDENGNSLGEMLDKYTTRIKEMLDRVLAMLLALMGRKAPEMSP